MPVPQTSHPEALPLEELLVLGIRDRVDARYPVGVVGNLELVEDFDASLEQYESVGHGLRHRVLCRVGVFLGDLCDEVDVDRAVTSCGAVRVHRHANTPLTYDR